MVSSFNNIVIKAIDENRVGMNAPNPHANKEHSYWFYNLYSRASLIYLSNGDSISSWMKI
jgi:hypothetical protein